MNPSVRPWACRDRAPTTGLEAAAATTAWAEESPLRERDVEATVEVKYFWLLLTLLQILLIELNNTKSRILFISLRSVRFFSKVFYSHQGCIYLVKYLVKTVILWKIITNLSNCFLFEYIVFYSVIQSWIFSIIIPVFSVTWSFRNSNMLICYSRNICWNVENRYAA